MINLHCRWILKVAQSGIPNHPQKYTGYLITKDQEIRGTFITGNPHENLSRIDPGKTGLFSHLRQQWTMET